MDTKTTAELVESARLAAERSMKWTAEKSGIALSTYRRKAAGGADFTISEMRRIALALNVEPWTLLPREFVPERWRESRSA